MRENEKKATARRMARRFEASVTGGSCSKCGVGHYMRVRALYMSATARPPSKEITAVAAASGRGGHNVQTVASACEGNSTVDSERSASGQSGGQVAAKAFREAIRPPISKSMGWRGRAKIGDVGKMISDIGARPSSGAQCHDRGGAGRLRRQGFCGRRVRG